MYSFTKCAKMIWSGILQRRLNVRLSQAIGFVPNKPYSDEKKPTSIFFWAGGLDKLQGGLKEEEYFNSLTQTLMGKMHIKKDDESYLPNWDEFHKTLNHCSLINTSCMNKHKNILEEAFFLNETADNIKLLHDRAQGEQKVLKNPVADILEHVQSESHTIK